MAGGTDLGPQSPVSGIMAFCMAGSERGELASTLPDSSWESDRVLQLLFSHKLTDRCENTKGSNTEAPVGQDGIERWVMPLLRFQTTVAANIQRCRPWPYCTVVLHVKGAHTHIN